MTRAENKPYTCVETTDKPGPGRLHGVSFYDSRVRASAGLVDGEWRPYLYLGSRYAEVTVSTTGGGPVSPADVEAAERIARAAASYRDLIKLAYKRQNSATEDASEA